MLRRTLFGTTVLTATTLLAQTAAADITATDVWDTYSAIFESYGAQVIGEPTADGSDMIVADSALLFRFPFDVATLRVSLPDMRMTENGDGTVSIAYPDAYEMRLEFDAPSEGAGTVVLATEQTNFVSTASGTPGDVVIENAADAFTISVKDITLPDGAEEEFDLSAQIESTGYASTTHVVVGDMITTTTTVTGNGAVMAYAVTTPDGFATSNTGTIGATEGTYEVAAPAGGSDVMNLSAALSAGAFLRGTTKGEGSTSETVTTQDGAVVSEQSQTTGPSTSTVSIDANGFDMFAEGDSATFKMLMQDLFPLPISGSLGKVAGGMKFPLLPSEDPQDVALNIELNDVTISDDLWAMADPSEQLPRDPISLNIDVAGTVISGIELLNFATFEEQFSQPVPPISLETLTINKISVSALGADAQATGSFIVDNTDMATFGGMPRPEGSGLLLVNGANALIDRLVAFGAIPQEQAGMARMGMGFIAKSTGDDSFETRLDVNPEGHVMVNGQRMR